MATINFGTDSKTSISNKGGGAIAVDSVMEADVWLQNKSITGHTSMSLIQIPDGEYWAAARRNPKARFITYHMTREAFRNKWIYTEPDAMDDDSLNPKLDKKLQTIRKEYNLRAIHSRAVWLSRSVKRSVVHKFPVKPVTDPKGPWYLRVSHVYDHQIKYDSDGNISYFNIMIKLGNDQKEWKIPYKDCELYINSLDPLGNQKEGISELESTYLPLLWMATILESWADIMKKRGLGILDIEIQGASEEDLKKLASEKGDPSQYTVIFHDESWKISAPAAVSAQYDLASMVSTYTKEVSSGNAVAEARLSGVQSGAVTGSKTDQDNFGQSIGAIQLEYNQNLINLHALCDSSIDTKKFDIKYDLSVRLDRKEILDNFATASNSVNQTLDMLSFNQVLAKLDLPSVDDGDMLAAQWIAVHEDFDKIIKPEENPHGPNYQSEDKPIPNDQKDKEREERKQEKRNKTEIKKTDGKDSYSRSELALIKRTRAREIIAQDKADSLYPTGNKEINIKLQEEFGSGLSFTTFSRLREELNGI